MLAIVERSSATRSTPGLEAELAALAGHSLAKRFRNWRGAGGRAYICTIKADFGELDDAREAVIIAVRRAGGLCAPIDLIASPSRAAAARFEARARRGGADEWHVHWLAVTPEARAAALADLRAAMRNEPRDHTGASAESWRASQSSVAS